MTDPNRMIRSAFLLLFFLICISGCRSYFHDEDKLYSTRPGRAYKYGNVLDKEDCKYYIEIARAAGITNGDVMADVGAASGYIDGAFSLAYDSVTFYLEDIETDYLNKRQFNKVVDYYSKLRGRTQTNKFNFTLGTIHRTNLPNGIFDRVMIFNSLHEFTYVSDMLDDVYEKLKPDGTLIIEDEVSAPGKPYRIKGCNTMAYTEEEIVTLLSKHNLYLKSLLFPEGPEGINIFVFTKNKMQGDIYNGRRKNIDVLLPMVSELDSISVANDSSLLMKMGDTLIKHIAEINETYPFFYKFISDKSFKLMDDPKNYPGAIRILSLCLRLYPDSTYIINLLGATYGEAGDYNRAMKCITRVLILDPQNADAKELQEEIKQKIAKGKSSK